MYNLSISYKGSNLSCNQATWKLVHVALQLHDLGEQVGELRELSRASAQAHFLISLSVFCPSSTQGYRSSLPASGLHRHPSTLPYVSMSLVHWSTSHQVKGARCYFTPRSTVRECSLSQVTPADWVLCLLSAPLVQSIKPQDVPHLLTYGDSGPRDLSPEWQYENVALCVPLPGRVLRYAKPSQ